MTAKDLKNALLQEAVQGRLVPQIASEGNARDLLEEIKKSHTDLQISTKSADKKSRDLRSKSQIRVTKKELPPITQEEIPFDIPDSWCWCRLGELFLKITDGTHKTPKYLPSGVPFLSVKDMSSGKLDFSNTKFISEEEHKELYKRCNPERGDLLITKVGTTGIPVIVDTDKIFDLFVSVALCKPVGNIIYMKFMVAFINSPFVQGQIARDTIGSANKNWVIDKIANTVIPLPPLAEQKRIVHALEIILPTIEEYQKKEEELAKLLLSRRIS